MQPTSDTGSFYDPIAAGILDPCGGHTGQDYHNHTIIEKCFTTSGLVAEPWNNPEPDETKPHRFSGTLSMGSWSMEIGCVDEA